MSSFLSFANSNFISSLSTSLSTLLSTSSLCDVTLVCDDGQLSAHKLVLAASSSFFSSVFQLNPHNHPLLYLRGVKTDQLQALLQFIYGGSTAIEERMVTSFLAVAADLKIVGLVETQEKQLGDMMRGVDLERYAVQEDKESEEEMVHIDTIKQEEINISDPMNYNIKDVETTDEIHEKFEEISQHELPVQSNYIEPTRKTKEDKLVNSAAIPNQIRNIKAIHPKPLEMLNPTPTYFAGRNTGTSHMAGKTLAGRPKVQLVTNNVLAAIQRRKRTAPSIFCSVCQKTDHKTDNIKVHMESKREVQCKSCKLYFANCYNLSKHMKGRCKNKKE